VLSELASMRPPAERGYLVAHSIAKFRRAIRLRPEFDRACYNLGTVVYAHAGMLAAPGALSPQLSQARARPAYPTLPHSHPGVRPAASRGVSATSWRPRGSEACHVLPQLRLVPL